MSLNNSVSARILFVLLCMMIGTAFGIYFHSFPEVSRFFADFISTSFNLRNIDLIVLSLSFSIKIRMNILTLIFGLIGLWIVRK